MPSERGSCEIGLVYTRYHHVISACIILPSTENHCIRVTKRNTSFQTHAFRHPLPQPSPHTSPHIPSITHIDHHMYVSALSHFHPFTNNDTSNRYHASHSFPVSTLHPRTPRSSPNTASPTRSLASAQTGILQARTRIHPCFRAVSVDNRRPDAPFASPTCIRACFAPPCTRGACAKRSKGATAAQSAPQCTSTIAC